MVQITLDPDDVNQDVWFTLTDGRRVMLDKVPRAVLHEVQAQLVIHRSSYEHAFVPPSVQVAKQWEAREVTLDDVAPLHVHVAALLAKKVTQAGGSTKRALRPEIFLQTAIWVSGDGTVHTLEELTPSHRHNLLGWMERASERLEREHGEALAGMPGMEVADPWIAGTPVYRALAETVANESPLDLAKDAARQKAREAHFKATGEWPSD